MICRVLVVLLVCASPLGAQGTCELPVAVALRAEAGAVRSSIAALVKILQPAVIPARLDSVAQRLDSVATACVADRVTAVDVDFGFTTTTLWPGGHIGAFPASSNGTLTLCASVDVNGQLHLGDKAVTATYLPSGQGRDYDSVAFVVRPETPTTGLRPLCRFYWPDPPNYNVNVPTFPVVWESMRLRPDPAGILVAVPMAKPVVP